MKTAKEMLKVSKGNQIEPIVNEILDRAMNQALKGETSVRIRDYGFGHFGLSSFYNPGEKTSEQFAVIEKLEDLGYKTSIEVVETAMAYAWLKVSWDEAD